MTSEDILTRSVARGIATLTLNRPVHGSATAAGCQLITTCDLAIMTDNLLDNQRECIDAVLQKRRPQWLNI
ncbi:hypothetical protein HGO38_27825 [Rhizobium sp. CG5]|uniref:hypothetical protein n=1 Tax=Rhizobium sp. CG5 TaxID=2726076 RepID=UPI002034460D|nr:hypothetical protein [Rhizobium sp. CG5]MCM2477268.1 hypothetical protein [Rhizobium sp. CG5]